MVISRNRSRARPRRLCTLASDVKSRSAISAVLKPHSVFRARTRRDSQGMASSQHTNSIRSMSSRISSAKNGARDGHSSTSRGGLFAESQAARLVTEILDEPMVRDPVEPRTRIFRYCLLCPGCERGHERGLDRVFDELDVAHADPPPEHGNQPAVVVPEEVLH